MNPLRQRSKGGRFINSKEHKRRQECSRFLKNYRKQVAVLDKRSTKECQKNDENTDADKIKWNEGRRIVELEVRFTTCV